MVYQPPPGMAPVVMVKQQKSVAIAVVLAFFFGPLGMFYGTVRGAVIMLITDFLLFFLGLITLGVGYFLYLVTWLVGIFWVVVEVNKYNRSIATPVVPVVAVQPGVMMPGPMSQPYPGQSGPYQQPGSMPQSGLYPQPGSMPQSGPYQQPGSQPNPYQQPPQ